MNPVTVWQTYELIEFRDKIIAELKRRGEEE